MANLVTFDASLEDRGSVSQEGVYRTGLLFRLGDYPDKNFSLNEAEADRAIAAFAPIEADYEHTPGPLDGKLGQIVQVWRDGQAIMGKALVPSWLDPLLADVGRKLSLTWHRRSKMLVGWAWTTSPRVSDAALMSSYATFAGARHSAGDQEAINQIHDKAVAAGATNCPGMDGGGSHSMSVQHNEDQDLMAKIKAFFAQQSNPAPAAPPDPQVAALAAQVKAMEEREKEMAATFALQRRQGFAREALTYVDAQIEAKRVPPYLRGAFAAQLADALDYDANHAGEVVAFTDASQATKQGGRADLVRYIISNLPVVRMAPGGAVDFTLAPDTSLMAIPGKTPEPPEEGKDDPRVPMSKERREELLSLTPAGQMVLEQERRNGH